MGYKIHQQRRSLYTQNDVMSQINITPFVDVMLVLLIIFMVTAPLMTTGVQVDLPETKAGLLKDPIEPLTLTIDKKKNLYLQKTPVKLKTLGVRLDVISKHNKDMQIYIRADERVPYGDVMKVMGEINANGFGKVALLTHAFAEN